MNQCQECNKELTRRQKTTCSLLCKKEWFRKYRTNPNKIWTEDYKKNYQKNYRKDNKEKIADSNRIWRADNKEYLNIGKKQERKRLKLDVVLAYSPSGNCQKCGFNDLRALQIDHINNDGAEERRRLFGSRLFAGTTFYRWVRRNNYPTGYQVLCANCNTIKFQETL